jgi:hypothetical protein
MTVRYPIPPTSWFPLLCEGNTYEISYTIDHKTYAVPAAPEFHSRSEAELWIASQIKLFEETEG